MATGTQPAEEAMLKTESMVSMPHFACLRLSLVLIALGACHAQSVGIQLIVGVPISDFKTVDQPFRFGGVETFTNRYIAGMFGELRLTERIGFEVGALYRRTHVTGATRAVSIWPEIRSRAVGGTWLVPLSAKYRITRGRVAPFVAGGPAMIHTGLSGSTDITDVLPPPGGVASTTSAFNETSWSTGWTVGGGLDIAVGRLRLSPQVRYVHSRALQCRVCGLSADFPAISPVYIMLGAGF
jgi:opacity protein-like surface antigen